MIPLPSATKGKILKALTHAQSFIGNKNTSTINNVANKAADRIANLDVRLVPIAIVNINKLKNGILIDYILSEYNANKDAAHFYTKIRDIAIA